MSNDTKAYVSSRTTYTVDVFATVGGSRQAVASREFDTATEAQEFVAETFPKAAVEVCAQ
jgi:DNA topoisomerase IB